ncbi:MAG: hypothetical protein RLZZ192_1180 [Pseudomonadota bacterium]|jgi:uncharacterized OB-fold protein
MNSEHVTLHTQALAANPAFAFFWEATKRNSLLLPHCQDCGKTHWYPRLFCTFCFSTNLDWRESSGEAKVHAATALSKSEEPYVVAYVELAEGPLMLTNIVDCSLDELKIGTPLQLTFSPLSSGHFIPVFRPMK